MTNVSRCGWFAVSWAWLAVIFYRVPLVDHLTFAVSRAVSKIFTLGKIDRGKYMVCLALIGRGVILWLTAIRDSLR